MSGDGQGNRCQREDGAGHNEGAGALSVEDGRG